MRYLAADFGAGSGRVIVGTVGREGVVLEEIHRFPNRQVRLGGVVHWDFLSLFEELKQGLKKAFSRYDDIYSIGVDTWGVDFGLLDARGRLISNPVCYRDLRTHGILAQVDKKISREDLYACTGNQLMEINTAFQLYSMVLHGDPLLTSARKLLFMPDMFNYFLSGVAVNEYTIASTSQLLHPGKRCWAKEVFEVLGLPLSWMQPVVPSGTILGELLPEVVSETGGNGVKVIAVGSHDTASAVASIDVPGNNWAFISSGTWSLMGIKMPEPVLTPVAMELNYTNEGTVDGEFRLLKNITGLWLLQQVMKEWEAEGIAVAYGDLIDAASRSDLNSTVDVDDAGFSNPRSMREAIAAYCAATGQQPPVEPGEYMRCIVLSLAKKYAEVKEQLEQISGRRIDTIHILGGGSRNTLLNRLTGELTGCRIITGETEATAIGNIMVQNRTRLNREYGL